MAASTPKFEKYFRLVSYAAVFCGFLSLWVSGTFGIIATGLFIASMFGAWFLEDSKWQISERLGTVLIVAALPTFYMVWRLGIVDFTGGETVLAGILARGILTLTVVKLLQRKSDRDWVFLYLMSFFEILLAAGLSISALYLASFIAYLLVMACTIIVFEVRKTSRTVERNLAAANESVKTEKNKADNHLPFRRLLSTAVLLIVFIIALALPMFFMLPRISGAGMTGSPGGGLKTATGFSDKVTLGRIGEIQQSDAIVMRIKLEGNTPNNDLYFRGVALDTFDNQTWSRSKIGPKEPHGKLDGEFIQVDEPANRDYLSIQTIYLEPLDSSVLFALPRAVAIQGNFPILFKDAYGAITYQRSSERISYKVLSDRYLPPVEQLRKDNSPYTADVQNYRSLPAAYDLRIADLAAKITETEKSRYDKAKAVERYLQTNFGYTLNPKSGGREPLADFLFNRREGHCEYFASSMAIMLRTQGIASRIVNGFHGGEYNDAADVTVVRQRDAHSWVEVYFPKEDVWITFDPTPAAEQGLEAGKTGIAATFNKYIEALETYWIQYFVAFDNQEQRSLARTFRNGIVDYQAKLAAISSVIQDAILEWWAAVRGDQGIRSSARALIYSASLLAGTVVGIVVLIWLSRKVRRQSMFGRIWKKLFGKRQRSIVEFYERMQGILTKQGLTRPPHQTPWEFAIALDMPEAVQITEKYNAVRYGQNDLSTDESREIERWLDNLKNRKNA